jgi:pyruvate/2-oxoglutarate dehydrogenase complex dihydrolipoamide acyltransferase (E2) component
MDKFIDAQMAQGEVYNYMHLIIAGMVRIFANFPRLNRFVMNGRIYSRNTIQVSFVVKKDMSPEAPDSLVKLEFTGLETLPEVQKAVDAAIEANNNISANNGTEKLARILTITPNFMIKCLIGFIKFLDKHSMLPNAIIRLSPFHTSLFVTNLKSIKGPGLYHHLYNFGTTGIFMGMGKESIVPVVEKGEIVPGKRMPVHIVTDERFCDGFYFVTAMKQFERMLKNPAILMEPIASLTEDVRVLHKKKDRKMAREAEADK